MNQAIISVEKQIVRTVKDMIVKWPISIIIHDTFAHYVHLHGADCSNTISATVCLWMNWMRCMSTSIEALYVPFVHSYMHAQCIYIYVCWMILGLSPIHFVLRSSSLLLLCLDPVSFGSPLPRPQHQCHLRTKLKLKFQRHIQIHTTQPDSICPVLKW